MSLLTSPLSFFPLQMISSTSLQAILSSSLSFLNSLAFWTSLTTTA